MNWCKLLGHKWRVAYVGKNDSWRIILAYCERCDYGREGIMDFLNKMKYKKGYDFATYNEYYFIESRQEEKIIKDSTTVVMMSYPDFIKQNTNTVYYKNYEKFEDMPLVAQCDETRKEYNAFWKNYRKLNGKEVMR